MAEQGAQDLQVRQKQEVSGTAEQTQADLVFTPVVDIFESEQQIKLLADMPGVKPEDLKIDLNDNVLTIIGDVKSPEHADERVVLREYGTGRYYRQFTISDAIDQSKIEAQLKDGVLSLTLPKAEAAKPRKITVKAG